MTATEPRPIAPPADRPVEPLDVPPPPPAHRVEWRRAVRALRALLADPEQTEKAFEVFLTLDGGQDERMFQRLVSTPQGRRLAAERPSLLDRLSDRAALAALPDGSFGRAYLVYLDRAGFDPGGLVRLKDQMEAHAHSIGEQLPVLDPLRDWLRVRGIVMHDLWHVLTDYGTDGFGEAALLAFSHAQLPGRASGLLVVGAALRCVAEYGVGFVPYLFRAWRRGRRAAWLPELPYESLLAEPLADVRRRAAITPSEQAHPGGILSDPLAADRKAARDIRAAGEVFE
jgi:ubiquinone biosynthesis protein COQ4